MSSRGDGPGGSGGIAQTIDQLFDGVVVALEGSAVLVGELDLDAHPLSPFLASSNWASLEGCGM